MQRESILSRGLAGLFSCQGGGGFWADQSAFLAQFLGYSKSEKHVITAKVKTEIYNLRLKDRSSGGDHQQQYV